MERPVLCALDFSPCGEAAFDHAVRLAQDTGRRLVLVHALRVFDVGQGAPPDLQRQLQAAKEELRSDEVLGLTTQWAQKARDLGVEVESVADERDAQELVLEAARTHDPFTIVVGTHGRSGLQRFLLGSVSDGIVKASRWPVTVVPCPE